MHPSLSREIKCCLQGLKLSVNRGRLVTLGNLTPYHLVDCGQRETPGCFWETLEPEVNVSLLHFLPGFTGPTIQEGSFKYLSECRVFLGTCPTLP